MGRRAKQEGCKNMTYNLGNPAIKVWHQNLVRASDDSPYRSRCPFCSDGILFVSRDQTSLRLSGKDMCSSCGQKVIYRDIGALRTREGIGES